MTAAHRNLLALASALVLAAVAAPVLGHASLVSSTPADGSAVPIASVTSITLTFDDELDAAKSKFDLIDGGGTTTATGHVGADAKTMTVSGLALAAGDYQVRWTAVASDGDLTRGVVSFKTIGDGAVSIAPTPAPTSRAGAPAPGAGSDVLLPILAAAAIVAVAGAFLLRRSRSA